jgi:hypothetical protein
MSNTFQSLYPATLSSSFATYGYNRLLPVTFYTHLLTRRTDFAQSNHQIHQDFLEVGQGDATSNLAYIT